jgi:HEPN domain-containing protein
MARKDLRAIAAMLDPDVFAEEIFGFHAQQAVEKAIKAVLSLIGRIYPRTHDLAALLELLERGPEVMEVGAWDLVDLTDFAVQLRYDSYGSEDDPLDRSAILLQVEAVVERVEVLVSEGR